MKKIKNIILFIICLIGGCDAVMAQTTPVNPVQLTTNSAWLEPSTGYKWYYNGSTYLWWKPLQYLDTVNALATKYYVGHGFTPSGTALLKANNLSDVSSAIVALDNINGVSLLGSYTNPPWIVSLPYTKITGTPSSLPPSGAAGGSLAGSYPNPTIASSVNLPGSPTTTTQGASDSTTKAATTAFVKNNLANGKSITTTVAGLRSITSPQASVLYQTTDMGGGPWYWNATDTRADNTGTIIKATSITTGRFNRVFDGTNIYAVWFGAVADGSTDDYDAIQNTINYGNTLNLPIVHFPQGTIYLNKASAGFLVTPSGSNGITYEGAGKGATVFKLSRNVPMLFNCLYLADGQVYKNLHFKDFTVDANNINGNSLFTAKTVANPFTLASGTTIVTINESNADLLNYQLCYLPLTNSGTSKGKVFAITPRPGFPGQVYIRNDASTSYTISVGDTIKGGMADPILFGSFQYGGSKPFYNYSFDDITFDNIDGINGYSQQGTSITSVQQTVRSWVNIENVSNPGNIQPQYVTNIRFNNMHLQGANLGIQIAGETLGAHKIRFINHEDVWHDSGLLPTANYTALSFLVGGNANSYGSEVFYTRCQGYHSGDVTFEVDNIMDAVYRDCYAASGMGGYYSNNFAPPVWSGTYKTATLTSSILSSDPNAPISAFPTGVQNNGYCLIDGETMYYTRTNNTSISIFRDLNGTTAAAHASGAVITFIEVDKQSVQYINCTYRDDQMGGTGGPGFYQYNFSPYIQPSMVVKGGYYERTSGGIGLVGEAVKVNGVNLGVTIDGLKVRISGINQPTGSGLHGAAIDLGTNGVNYNAFTNYPSTKTTVKNLDIAVDGFFGTGIASTYAAVKWEKGYWDIDAGDNKIAMNINNGVVAALGYDFNSNTSVVFKGKIYNTKFTNLNGDGAPIAVNIPSTSFAVVRNLQIRDMDFSDLIFATGSNNANYQPFKIDATNQDNVFISGTLHSQTLTGGYTKNPLKQKRISSAYTALNTDEYIGVTGGTPPITLPPVTIGSSAYPDINSGGRLVIADEAGAAATNNIVITAASGEFINGLPSYTINTNYGSVTLLKTRLGFNIQSIGDGATKANLSGAAFTGGISVTSVGGTQGVDIVNSTNSNHNFGSPDGNKIIHGTAFSAFEYGGLDRYDGSAWHEYIDYNGGALGSDVHHTMPTAGGILANAATTLAGYGITDAINTFGTQTGLSGNKTTAGVWTFQQNGVGAATTPSIILANTTAATSGVPLQNSPGIEWDAQIWNNTALASQTGSWRVDVGGSQANPINSTWALKYSGNGGGYSQLFSVVQNGDINVSNRVLTATVSGPTTDNTLFLQTRNFTGANPGINFNNNTFSGASVGQTGKYSNPTLNQTGSSSYIDDRVNINQTALGSGGGQFFLRQVGAVTKYSLGFNGNSTQASTANIAQMFSGTTGTDSIMVHKSGGGLSVISPTAFIANPMTNAGDLIYGGASGVPTRLAPGSPGALLGVAVGGSLPEYKIIAGNDGITVSTSTGSMIIGNAGGALIKYQKQIFTPTTGGSVNLVAGFYNIINPAGALLTLTVNLPSSPVDRDVVYIKFTQNITTVTYANGTVVDGITAPTAGGLTVLEYDSGTTSWY